jgi:hypothetical protein
MKPIETNPASGQAFTNLVSAATGALANAVTTKLLQRRKARKAARSAPRKPAQRRTTRAKGGKNHG